MRLSPRRLFIKNKPVFVSALHFRKIKLNSCINDTLDSIRASGKKNVKYTKYRNIADKFFLKKYFFYLMLDPTKNVNYNVYDKANIVLDYLVGEVIRLHIGLGWKTIIMSWHHGGFKFGEFAKYRRIFVFRSKTLKKKKKARKIGLLHEIKIKKIRLLKAAKIKKNRTISRSGLNIIY